MEGLNAEFRHSQNHLKQKIRDKLKPVKTHDGATKKFLPRLLAEKVLGEQQTELEKLFSNLGDSDSNPFGTSDGIDIANQIIDGHVSATMCTLLYIEADATTLGDFGRDLVQRPIVSLARTYDGLSSDDGSSSDEDSSADDEFLSDDKLPLTEDGAKEHFPSVFKEFYDAQFMFCPIILQKNKLVKYKGDRARCLGPFLEPEKLGEGAYGKVYKVKVPGLHIKVNNQDFEKNEKRLAKKDFRVERDDSGSTEWEVVRKILRNSPHTHPNIMSTFAGLEHGKVFSIFFDVAEYNLWHYLSGSHPIAIKHAEEDRETGASKREVFERTIGLVSALHFLHEQLYLRDGNDATALECYHMDLKPENILVANDENNNKMWKLTDFGMSKVRETTSRLSDVQSSDLNQLFKRRKERPEIRHSGFANYRRGFGAYLAPEAYEEGNKAGKPSDIWSLGCVIAVIMSFLHGGSTEVINFSKRRLEGDGQDTDSFFGLYPITQKSLKPSYEITVWKDRSRAKQWSCRLKEEVPETLERLAGMGKADDLNKEFCLSVANLLKKVLLPDPAKRNIEAIQVERTLQDSLKMLKPASDAASVSKSQSLFGGLRRFGNRFKNKPRIRPKALENASRCRFSPDGSQLAILYRGEDAIMVYELASLLETIPGEKALPIGRANLKEEKFCKNAAFCFTTDWLVAAIMGPIFDLCLINMTKDRNVRFAISELGAIQFAASSISANVVAFKLENDSRILILSMPELLELTEMESSSIALEDLKPKARLAVFNPGSEEVDSLKFSADGRYLACVAKAPGDMLNVRTIVWRTNNWSSVKREGISIGNKGVDDASSLLLASFALTSIRPLLVFTGQREKLEIVNMETLARYDGPGPSFAKISHLFALPSAGALVVLGTDGSKNFIKASRVEIAKNGEWRQDATIKYDLVNFQPAKDDVCLHGENLVLAISSKGFLDSKAFI